MKAYDGECRISIELCEHSKLSFVVILLCIITKWDTDASKFVFILSNVLDFAYNCDERGDFLIALDLYFLHFVSHRFTSKW